jgi:DNA uptake protein ComE-like DNA-binding protein
MPLPQLWTRHQRIVVLATVGVLLTFLVVQYWREPIGVPEAPPPDGPRSAELADKVDPNTADAAELAAIRTLGEKRAAEIVAYRDEFLRSHPNQIAFASPNGLLKLKNFGPATVSNIEPYLIFPRRAPTTRQNPDWDAR